MAVGATLASKQAQRRGARAEVYAALRRELGDRKLSTGLGDEGGFAPEITEPEEVLQLLVPTINDAGYRAGREGWALPRILRRQRMRAA